MTLQTVTANLLAGGLVVFLTARGRWSAELGEAALAHSKEEAAELLRKAHAANADNVIVDPYLIDIIYAEDGSLRPKKFREYLRTQGPTVRTDLGYQAARAPARKSA